MGLDMYAYSVPQGEDVSAESTERSQIAYWRKFNALHGWMEDLYREREGGTNDFNCIPLQLTPEDLDRLELDLKKGLTPRQGFFFGAQEIYPEDVESTVDFIAHAREELANGKDVYYDSWW